MKIRIVVLIFSFIALYFAGYAGEGRVTREKKLSRHYNVKPGDKLEIDNIYGQLHVNTWDKNEVTVDVTITCKAATDDRANSEIDRVNIRNSADDGKIKYKTIIGGRGDGGNSSLKIDYMINAPKRIAADLTDKYGDIYLDDLDGNLKLDLAYGGLSARAINGNQASLHIEYSNGTIGFVKNGVLNVSYSNLSIEKAEDVNIRNDYGKLDIGQVQKLVLDQKSGNLQIDEVGTISGSITYTSFRIDRLSKGATLDLKYCGRADIGTLAPTVDNIFIDAAYSSVTLKPEAGDNFSIDARASYGDIINRSSLKQLQLEFQEKSSQNVTYTGKMGNGAGRMHLTARYGNFTFK